MRYNKYFDTVKLNSLYSFLDTSVQRKISRGFLRTKQRAKVLPGKQFPKMKLVDTLNRKFDLSKLKGKIVFIDFWASWCVPCRDEMPKLIQLYEKYKEKGFVVIAIYFDEKKEKWLKAIKDDSLPWKHFRETDWDNSAFLNEWGIDSVPYNFLVDKSGILVDKEMSMNMLEKELERLLN